MRLNWILNANYLHGLVSVWLQCSQARWVFNVRYRKFKRGKDISSYSATAMQEIMGTRPPEAQPEPELPFPYVHGSQNASKSEASKHSSEDDSQLITVKSSQSIQDYFKNKMAGVFSRDSEYLVSSFVDIQFLYSPVYSTCICFNFQPPCQTRPVASRWPVVAVSPKTSRPTMPSAWRPIPTAAASVWALAHLHLRPASTCIPQVCAQSHHKSSHFWVVIEKTSIMFRFNRFRNWFRPCCCFVLLFFFCLFVSSNQQIHQAGSRGLGHRGTPIIFHELDQRGAGQVWEENQDRRTRGCWQRWWRCDCQNWAQAKEEGR